MKKQKTNGKTIGVSILADALLFTASLKPTEDKRRSKKATIKASFLLDELQEIESRLEGSPKKKLLYETLTLKIGFISSGDASGISTTEILNRVTGALNKEFNTK